MSEWHKAASIDDCDEGAGIEVIVAGRVIGLFRTADGWHALDGTCPHHGGPLGQGKLHQSTDQASDGCVAHEVECPWHGLRINVQDGTYHLAGPGKLDCFETKVEDGQVLVRIPSGK